MPAPVTWVWERFRSSFRSLHSSASDTEPDDDESIVSIASFMVQIQRITNTVDVPTEFSFYTYIIIISLYFNTI